MKYNVVAEYDWTSMPRGSAMRKKAPRVWVKSYKLKSNQIMQVIKNFMALSKGSNDAKSFYDKMYGEATVAEDDFNFPFLSDNIRSFSNEFGDTFQSGSGGSGGILAEKFEDAKRFAGGVAEAVNMGRAAMGESIPGTYIETPKFYQFDNNSDGPLKVEFVLSNTINADSLEKNKNLIYRLTYINRPLRQDSIAVDPPRIYQVKVPGHRFIRWAYCSDFTVDMQGARREINGVIVPEAYRIDMSFKSLTLEHAGFMKEV